MDPPVGDGHVFGPKEVPPVGDGHVFGPKEVSWTPLLVTVTFLDQRSVGPPVDHGFWLVSMVFQGS